MRFSNEILANLLQRQLHRKNYALIGALGANTAAVPLDYLLGYGKAEPRTACRARAGGIETEKLLEYAAELFRGNGLAPVFDVYNGHVAVFIGTERNGAVGIAVIDGVSQEIINDAGELVPIGIDGDVRVYLCHPVQVFLLEQGVKLAYRLLEQQTQIQHLSLKAHCAEAKARDVKKLVYQILQPQRFIKSDARVLCAELRGDVRLVLNKTKIANDARERGL